MRVLVVFDSVFGNTERLGRAMADRIGADAQVDLLRAGEALASRLEGTDLLLVGSPTRGFRPTPAIAAFLDELRGRGLAHLPVAAFDTRLSAESGSRALRWLLRTGGWAAERIGARLVKAGGRLVAPPEGFVVAAEKGPLAPDELQRACAWASALVQSVRPHG